MTFKCFLYGIGICVGISSYLLDMQLCLSWIVSRWIANGGFFLMVVFHQRVSSTIHTTSSSLQPWAKLNQVKPQPKCPNCSYCYLDNTTADLPLCLQL